MLDRQKSTAHIQLRKLPDVRFAVVEYSHSTMPVILPYTIQPVIYGSPVAFDALHEIESITDQEPGDSKSLTIALCNGHDCQEIVPVDTRTYSAHEDERGNRTGGHMQLSLGSAFYSPSYRYQAC
ncbi:MAG: hypothetical protein V7679_01315 [Parasphingorhabdus sp.]